MININKVELTGNLTRDPLLRTTDGGFPVVNLRIGSNHYHTNDKNEKVNDPCFVDVEAFNETATACANRLGKGDCILVEGRLRMDMWKAKDEQVRTKLIVRAHKIQFITIKKKKTEVETVLESDVHAALEDAASNLETNDVVSAPSCPAS